MNTQISYLNDKILGGISGGKSDPVITKELVMTGKVLAQNSRVTVGYLDFFVVILEDGKPISKAPIEFTPINAKASDKAPDVYRTSSLTL